MQCFQTKKIKNVRSVLQALAYGLAPGEIKVASANLYY